ncbi:MAG TPA: Bug family tripartite tricarboxylate transporter substrate binding protein, partial [Casimicrobiaceae bacterium]|nr:Bug family tripartite tricarboxylate transporter substrate binding protein [Casimicrobiaceae bacterium]
SLSFGMVALLLVTAPLAAAQDRIDKPVRIVVGFAAGGTADVMARVVADKLKDSLGQPVIVDNRPGAIGRIAAEAVRNAAPDGATIMVMPIGPMAVVPHVYSDIPYDPVKDFTAVALGSTFQFAIAAGPASGAKTWSEFAAWVKANPGKAAYATSGAGSLPHFFGVLLSRELGVAMVHVPYKGSAAYVGDLVSGQVPAAVDAIADLTELHRAGRIRILASSGAARSTAVPEVPTFNELGLKGVEATGWFGFFAPAKTPKPIVDLLNRGINKALQSPDVVEKLSKLGLDPATGTPEEFARIVAADYAKWGPIVKASGFKPE